MLKPTKGTYLSLTPVSAKKILIDEVEKLNLEKYSKPPTRRGVQSAVSDHRVEQEIRDIVNIILCLDEHKLRSNICTFVVADISRIPSAKLEDGDIRAF